jgi:hypothetical protein
MRMASLNTLRRLLEISDVRRDPYAVAEICGELLERDAGDLQAGFQYLRVMAALELGTVARRLLEGLRRENPRVAELAETMERLPAGVIPWSSRRRRFQANLRALEARGISAAPLLATWDDPAQRNAERYELHQAVEGNFFVVERSAGSGGEADGVIREEPWKAWVGGSGGLQDYKGANAGVAPESFQGRLCGPLAFDGMGYGWLLLHILKASEKAYLNYSPAIYVVEPDLTAVCMLLHMHDWQEWINRERLRLFIGENAAERFVHSFEEHAGWSVPTTIVTQPLRPRPLVGLQTRAEQVTARRAQQRQASLDGTKTYYAGRGIAAWRRRFAEAAAGGAPLRVLGITTRYSTVLRYSMEELQASAQSCPDLRGRMEMAVCMEPDDHSLENDCAGMVERFKPDLLVTISRLRSEMPDLPRNVPALCWDQDNLPCMRDPSVLADLTGLSFVAGHGAIPGCMQLNWPEGACIFCYPAGMTHRYSPAPATAEELSQFGSDVSYVSHASGSPEQLRANLRGKWEGGAKGFLPLLDASSEEIVALAWRGEILDYAGMEALISRIGAGLKLPVPAAVAQSMIVDLRLQLDRTFRHQTLDWVSRWCDSRGKRLRIWGNGWKDHPTLGKWAAGVALPGEQAQAVYRASRINLQIIETGVLHSRLFDGWAAGGFFMIRQAHRPKDEQEMMNFYRIGRLTQDESIETIGQLEERGSQELRRLWKPWTSYTTIFDRKQKFPGFRIWRNLAPPQVVIPNLDRIMFNSASEFERMADEFCRSEESRQSLWNGICEVLNAKFSYDARWKEFLGHVTSHLGYEVPAARP